MNILRYCYVVLDKWMNECYNKDLNKNYKDLFYCHVSAFGSDTPITAMNRSELARLIKTTREIHIPVEIMKGEYTV